MFRGAIRLAISNGVKSSRTLAKSSAGVKASQKLFFSAALAAPLVGLKDNSAQETYVSRMKVGRKRNSFVSFIYFSNGALFYFRKSSRRAEKVGDASCTKM